METSSVISQLNKKLSLARGNGFKFNHINKLTIKMSQKRDYIQTHCNDYRETFHFACPQWYSYLNSYTNTSIIIPIFV